MKHPWAAAGGLALLLALLAGAWLFVSRSTGTKTTSPNTSSANNATGAESASTRHPSKPATPPPDNRPTLADGTPVPDVDPADMLQYVNKYCGACHKPPPPDILPSKTWPKIVSEMAATWLPTVGVTLTRPQIAAIAGYYVKLAPDELPRLPDDYPPSPIHFQATPIGNKGFLTPMATNVNITDLNNDGRNDMVVTDAEMNTVSVIQLVGDKWVETKLADVKAPVHAQVIDVDGDGRKDIVVASLGQMLPTDDLIGGVTLLRQVQPMKFEPQVIAHDIDRVTDARAADVDGDGDMDYIVGMFGWRKSGGMMWIEQLEDGTFYNHIIAKQHGPIRLQTTDLNADGLVDFVILIAQEFEQVIAYINNGDDGYEEVSTRFDPYILFDGPYPMYGSSGMRMADLDRDGDLDVLFTNGDAFDLDKNPKPYHGVQWLENVSGTAMPPRFVFHDIGRFYGAMAADAGDLDGDGDIDVVAASQYNDWRRPDANCLVWFENDGKQHFVRHNLGRATTHLATVAVGDVDGDGRLDIVGGAVYTGASEVDDNVPFRFPPPGQRNRVMLWRQIGEGKQAQATPTRP